MLALYEAEQEFALTSDEIRRVKRMARVAASNNHSAIVNEANVITALNVALRDRPLPSVRTAPPSRTTIGTPFRVPLSISVSRNGNPVDGIEATFRIYPDTSSGTFVGGKTKTVEVTDRNGVATAPNIVAGNKVGTFTVEATVPNVDMPIIFKHIVIPRRQPATISLPPLKGALSRQKSATEMPSVRSVDDVIRQATIKHGLTEAEIAQAKSLADHWAAKKKNNSNHADRTHTAIVFILKERAVSTKQPSSQRDTGKILSGKEIEWSVTTQAILTKAVAKHNLTHLETARIIALANGMATIKGTVMDHGYVASAIGAVLVERYLPPK